MLEIFLTETREALKIELVVKTTQKDSLWLWEKNTSAHVQQFYEINPSCSSMVRAEDDATLHHVSCNTGSNLVVTQNCPKGRQILGPAGLMLDISN